MFTLNLADCPQGNLTHIGVGMCLWTTSIWIVYNQLIGVN